MTRSGFDSIRSDPTFHNDPSTRIASQSVSSWNRKESWESSRNETNAPCVVSFHFIAFSSVQFSSVQFCSVQFSSILAIVYDFPLFCNADDNQSNPSYKPAPDVATQG